MLTVKNGNLMVEEKGIFTTAKFLVSRRLMYWQVYLHKTVVAAEMMLVNIVKRAKELLANGFDVLSTSTSFDYFLNNEAKMEVGGDFEKFCLLDDYDVMATIKKWMDHPDFILSTLCRWLIDRRLLKVKLLAEPVSEDWVAQMRNVICKKLDVTERESRYFIFTGEAENTTYDPSEEKINILFKDGSIKDISEVDNALIHQTLSTPVKKFYICFYNA
jgi:HD superfamily phosphohydrolase